MIARWFAASVMFVASSAFAQTQVLDDFETLAPWTARHTDDVFAAITPAPGKVGRALHLQFDFAGVNGYATAQRKLALDFPENGELSFWIRGEAGVNNLQFKLVDASGANVWWINRPDFAFSSEWRQIKVKKRQIGFAWGPQADHALKHVASIEFVVSSGRDGGKGFVEFDQLELRPLQPPNPSPPKPKLKATSQLDTSPASAAMDGDANTAWRSNGAASLDIDFHEPREFSAVILRWRTGEKPTAYEVQQSDDGKRWRTKRGMAVRVGDADILQLPESEARYVRVAIKDKQPHAIGLSEIEFKDPDWGEERNVFLKHVAAMQPRGNYPRGFIEQPYWTIVGVDGGAAPALISEDGAIEPRKGKFSIEPFLVIEGKTLSWADVTGTQSLHDNYLPMPDVSWKTDRVELNVETFARGARGESQIVARYTVRNAGDAELDAQLQLALRPLQVNPPAQFLNAAGGIGEISDIVWKGGLVDIDGATVWPLQKPDSFSAVDGWAGWLQHATTESSQAETIHSDTASAAAAMSYRMKLPPHGEQSVVVVASIDGELKPIAIAPTASAWFDRERAAVAAEWRAKLDRVTLHVPPSAQRLVDALRTSIAYTLISRDGPALRPGTRAYARTWVRDGAMIEDGLLALGNLEASREFVEWFAPHQFSNGKVPCCVDHRGSDPVPENDSHGELIHAIAQLYRYSRDKEELQRNWPHVEAAVAYMETLRAAETGAANPAFKGLMPASISHEGYSAKPMHSYWDDLWALVGYGDAADMAIVLGRMQDANRFAAMRDAFRADLFASIAATVKSHAIDFLPGCAELGDFDATSSTIAIAQAGVQDALADLLHGTFERYWKDFEARAAGRREWKDYTPYEWRTVGAFVRLGWRDRAQAAIDFFFASGARPLAWNQWAEVVGHDVREIRFIGDMPHIWVASDFIRSTLDLFAYDRAPEHTLVIGAGIPAAWIDAKDGIGISGLRTPYGSLTYSVRRENGHVVLHIDKGISPPGGFVFASPFESASNTRINGKPAEWNGSSLSIAAAPADVTFDVAPSPSTH